MEIYPPKEVNLLTEVNLPKVKNHWSKRKFKNRRNWYTMVD